MGTYKVIQDIEADDKLLGPLTLRQFIYAIIVVVTAFIAFRLFIVNPLLALPCLPVMGFFGLLAAPFGHAQPNEVWLLAKIRFALKPRKRIWDQAGIKDLVKITAPKVVDEHLTKDFTQEEAKSRLRALANTIDSRGWAVKNVNVNLFSHPSFAMAGASGTDRLVNDVNYPQDVAISDVQAGDDMLDEFNNPRAQNLDRLMANAQQTHRQKIVAQMQTPPGDASQAAAGAPTNWFMNAAGQQAPPPSYATAGSQTVPPGSQAAPASTSQANTAEEQALLEQIQTSRAQENASNAHMRTIQPLGAMSRDNSRSSGAATDDSQAPDPAILELANNDDLNVSTIARQANKARGKEPPKDEVVVSLH